MICKVCGSQLTPQNAFCVSCGASTRPPQTPPAGAQDAAKISSARVADPSSAPKRQRALVFVVIAALLVGGGGIVAFERWNADRLERLAQEGVVEAFGERLLRDALDNCVAIGSVVEDIPEQRIAAYADSLQGITDPRQALATSQTADFPESAHLPGYEREVSGELLEGFRGLLRTSDRDDIAPPQQLERWEKEWSTFALDVCGAQEQYSTNVTLLKDADEILNRVRALAEDAPWYPEGFSEHSANLAFRWSTEEGGSPCRYCSFWKITVVSKSGCTSGLYGEINILRNGSVVDWTNDLVAYVAPGGSAIMTYVRYPSSSGLQGQLVELSCY